MYTYIFIHIHIYLLDMHLARETLTPNLPTEMIPAKISLLNNFRVIPLGPGISAPSRTAPRTRPSLR